MTTCDDNIHDAMGVEEARAITDRIVGYFGDLDIVCAEVADAVRRRVWVPLGYATFEQYWTCEMELGRRNWRVAHDELHEIVAIFRSFGLSQRAIATVTGYSLGTVNHAVTCSELNTSNGGPADGKTLGLDGKKSPAKRKRAPRKKTATEPVNLDEQPVAEKNEQPVGWDEEDEPDPVADFQAECDALGKVAKDAEAAREKRPKRPYTFSQVFDMTVWECANGATHLDLLCGQPVFKKKVARLQRADRNRVKATLATIEGVRDTVQHALDRINALNDFEQPPLPFVAAGPLPGSDD